MELYLSKIHNKFFKSPKFNTLILNCVDKIYLTEKNYKLSNTVENINDFINLYNTINFWWENESFNYYPNTMYEYWINNFHSKKILNEKNFIILIDNIEETVIVDFFCENIFVENQKIFFDFIIQYNETTKILNFELNMNLENYNIDIESFLLFSNNIEKSLDSRISMFSYTNKNIIFYKNNILSIKDLNFKITFFNKKKIIDSFRKIYNKLLIYKKN